MSAIELAELIKFCEDRIIISKEYMELAREKDFFRGELYAYNSVIEKIKSLQEQSVEERKV